MTNLWIVAVLLSVGCSMPFAPTPHDRYTVHIDSGISADHQEIALQALQDWHDRVGVVFDVKITEETCSSDYCIQLWEVEPGHFGQDLEDCPQGGVMGCTTASPFNDDNAYHIRIRRDMGGSEYLRPTVYRHEIGHSLGLQHVEGKVLMSPIYDAKNGDGALEITMSDVQQYNSIRGIQ
jgi:predicted Zn-dependent protease